MAPPKKPSGYLTPGSFSVEAREAAAKAAKAQRASSPPETAKSEQKTAPGTYSGLGRVSEKVATVAKKAPGGQPIIRLEDCTKRLGVRNILDHCTLRVEPGEAIVIIGRSGEGKSVTLKHICGLMKPDSGRVFVDGDDITDLNEADIARVRMKVGFLFQGAALFDSLTVAENVAFALRRHTDMPNDEIAARVEECLTMVGLKGAGEKAPSDLSGGMRKRAGLARAIAIRPKIMLYDEPTTGLDPIMSDVINELILSTQKQLGVTSVIVTHDMVSAYKIADRIAMLYQGRIVAQGTPQEIRASSDPMIRQFITGSAEGPLQVV